MVSSVLADNVLVSSGQTDLGAGTPTSIFGSNLLAWYKATDGVYKDAGSTLAINNDTVQQWNDNSGNGFHLSQATAGNRSTFKATGVNGRAGLQFVAANSNYMTNSS